MNYKVNIMKSMHAVESLHLNGVVVLHMTIISEYSEIHPM